MTTSIERWFPSFDGRQKRELEMFFNEVFPDLDFGGTSDVTGDVTGDVLADDEAKIINSGADIANSIVQAGSLIGALTGSASKLVTGTPVNAVLARGTLTLASNACIHGDTFVIGADTYKLWADFVNAMPAGPIEIDCTTGITTRATDTLTIDAAILGAETIEIGADTYEFYSGVAIGGGNIEVDIIADMISSFMTITFADGDIADDTITIDGNVHTLKSDGTADSATVVDITGAATIAPSVFTLTLAAVPGDGEILTVEGRTYEFDTSDDGIGGSDVEIDSSADVTPTDSAASVERDYNADGSKTYVAVAVGNVITFTRIDMGVLGDSDTITEDLADGAISGANPTGGADALKEELGPIFAAHMEAAGAAVPAGITATAVDEVVTLTVDIMGTAGDGLVCSDTLTAGAGVSGNTAGGQDCAKADAQTAFEAALAIQASTIYTFVAFGGGDTSVVTCNIGGTAGDALAAVVTSAGSSTFAGGGTLGSGADIQDSVLDGLIIAADADGAVAYVLSQGGGTTILVNAIVLGVLANAIIFTEALTGATMTGTGTLGGTGATIVGVDGTVAAQWDVLIDAAYIYIAVLANTIEDQNWERVGISSF
jgi:hypothetical protein